MCPRTCPRFRLYPWSNTWPRCLLYLCPNNLVPETAWGMDSNTNSYPNSCPCLWNFGAFFQSHLLEYKLRFKLVFSIPNIRLCRFKEKIHCWYIWWSMHSSKVAHSKWQEKLYLARLSGRNDRLKGPTERLQYRNFCKAGKRDLKKHGIQPFVSNKDLPMTQQRCVVSYTTPLSLSVVKYMF